MSTIGKFLKDLKSTWYVFAIALLLVFCFSYFVASYFLALSYIVGSVITGICSTYDKQKEILNRQIFIMAAQQQIMKKMDLEDEFDDLLELHEIDPTDFE